MLGEAWPAAVPRAHVSCCAEDIGRFDSGRRWGTGGGAVSTIVVMVCPFTAGLFRLNLLRPVQVECANLWITQTVSKIRVLRPQTQKMPPPHIPRLSYFCN